MTRKLKLYVWDDVFCDWSCGMALALAYDVQEARKLIAEQYAGGRASERAMKELAGTPRVIRLDENTKPQAWQVSGGA